MRKVLILGKGGFRILGIVYTVNVEIETHC